MQLPQPPWIAAHRGALPRVENTVPALELAVAEGADLLEFDVQVTADDTLVLMHDNDLGRLAGRPDLVVEQALARELQAVELRRPEAPGERAPVPTLAEALDCLPPGFPVNIELKLRRAGRARLAELAIAATAGRANVLFSSFDQGLLEELRRRSSSVALAPLAARWSTELERLATELGATTLHVAAGLARRCRANRERLSPRPPLLVYTVNQARRAHRLFELGATGVFTDRPGGLRRELGATGASGVLSRAYRGG